MTPADMTMTILTHPFQVVLMGVVLVQCVRAVLSAVAAARRPGTGSRPAPMAGPSHLRAA